MSFDDFVSGPGDQRPEYRRRRSSDDAGSSLPPDHATTHAERHGQRFGADHGAASRPNDGAAGSSDGGRPGNQLTDPVGYGALASSAEAMQAADSMAPPPQQVQAWELAEAVQQQVAGVEVHIDNEIQRGY